MSQFLRSALPGNLYIGISLVSKHIMLLEFGIIIHYLFPIPSIALLNRDSSWVAPVSVRWSESK